MNVEMNDVDAIEQVIQQDKESIIKGLLKKRVSLIARLRSGADMSDIEVEELQDGAKECLRELKLHGWVKPQK